MKRFHIAALLLAIMTAMCAKAQHLGLRPELESEGSFSLIVLPDPQNYVKFECNQPIFELMTTWIANNRKRLNIKTALCTGDLVDRNNTPVIDSGKRDQTSTQMWQASARAFGHLDGVLPYVLCTGNHDYGYDVTAVNRLSQFSNYFPPEKNPCWHNAIVSVCNNAEGQPSLENAAYEIETGSPAWGTLLIVTLEFTPRDTVLKWAKEVVGKKKYANTKVIVLTHSYLDKNGNPKGKEKYAVSDEPDANCGQDIWQKLISECPNISMVVCGHVCSIAPYDQNVSFSQPVNKAGKRVAQMMFNAQTADGYWNGNGGDGWLRILEFKPDGKTVSVRTFSPLFAVSAITADAAWRTGSCDQFSFELE